MPYQGWNNFSERIVQAVRLLVETNIVQDVEALLTQI